MADSNSGDQGGVSGVSGSGAASTADRADAARSAMDASRTEAEKAAEGMVAGAVSTLGNVCSIDTRALAAQVQAQPIDKQAGLIDAINDLLGPLDEAQFARDLLSSFANAPDVSGRAWEGVTVGGVAAFGPFSAQIGLQFDANGVSRAGGVSLEATTKDGVTVGAGLTDTSASVSVPVGGAWSVTGSRTPGPDGTVDRVGVELGLGKVKGVELGVTADIDIGDTGPKAGTYGAWQDRDETGKVNAAGVNVDNRKTTEFGQGVAGYYYDEKGRPTPYSTSTVANDWNNIMQSVYGTRR